jgi:hypothetical protein
MHDPEPEARRRRGASRPSQDTLRLSPSPCGESFFFAPSPLRGEGLRDEGRGQRAEGRGERVKKDARPRNASGKPGAFTVSRVCSRRDACPPRFFLRRSSGIAPHFGELSRVAAQRAQWRTGGHPVQSRAASTSPREARECGFCLSPSTRCPLPFYSRPHPS